MYDESVGSTVSVDRRAEKDAWYLMLRRCGLGAAHTSAPRYASKGITVCEEWRTSFEQFYADMGPRPSSAHSLDRENNDGDYTPSNCRWATLAEQGANKDSNVWVEFRGRRLLASHWAAELGLSPGAFASRLERCFSPERGRLPTRSIASYDARTGVLVAQYPSIDAAAAEVGGTVSALQHCLRGASRTSKGLAWRYID